LLFLPIPDDFLYKGDDIDDEISTNSNGSFDELVL